MLQLNSRKVIRLISLVLQQVIWAICLVLSIAASIFFYRSLSKSPSFQSIIPVMVITVECLAQLIFSRGKAECRAGRYIRAAIKIGLYGVYILFFGILSSLSFFVTHVSANERAIDKVIHQETIIERQREQNEQLIKALTESLSTETKTGFGRRSETIMAEINRLKEENKTAVKTDNSLPVTENQDTFRDVANVIKKVNANTLKFWSFTVLALFVFAGLIILNPDYLGMLWDVTNVTDVTVTDETVKHVTKKTVTRNSNKVTPEQTVTLKHVTNVTDDLCVCGCGRPRTGKGLYFSGACRTRLSRKNKKEALGA